MYDEFMDQLRRFVALVSPGPQPCLLSLVNGGASWRSCCRGFPGHGAPGFLEVLRTASSAEVWRLRSHADRRTASSTQCFTVSGTGVSYNFAATYLSTIIPVSLFITFSVAFFVLLDRVMKKNLATQFASRCSPWRFVRFYAF